MGSGFIANRGGGPPSSGQPPLPALQRTVITAFSEAQRAVPLVCAPIATALTPSAPQPLHCNHRLTPLHPWPPPTLRLSWIQGQVFNLCVSSPLPNAQHTVGLSVSVSGMNGPASCFSSIPLITGQREGKIPKSPLPLAKVKTSIEVFQPGPSHQTRPLLFPFLLLMNVHLFH